MLAAMPELQVVWEGTDERGVQRQLQEIDPRLFLDKEADGAGRIFYVVRYWENGYETPELVLDWRETSGQPKPLSSAVAYAIQKEMREGAVDVKGILRRNRDRAEKRGDEAQQMYEDIARDFDRHKRIGNFAVVPRSQGLRMSRDRIRARGGKA